MNNPFNQDILEQFETIWEHVECGIMIVDAETRNILDINPIAIRMFGEHKEKILGNVCHKFVCPANQKACPIMDKKQVVDRAERVFIRSNGETIPIIKSVAKIKYNGRPALLESFTDISKLKEAEHQLMTLKVTEQASQAKSDFLSRMSHEMRTPLAAILGMSRIAENTDDIEKIKHCISAISTSAQHMLGLVNDVLDMSKIEAGKLELNAGPVNVESVIKKMISLVTEEADKKGIELRVSLDNTIAPLYIGDEMRLSQVIANLLSNAVKFTPQGGVIHTSVQVLTCDLQGCHLRFSVSDTGIGMSTEQSSRLFDPFGQADESISRQYGGTGLGLTISKHIIENMNGHIWVESSLGEGSVFYFEIYMENYDEATKKSFFNYMDTSNLYILIGDEQNFDRNSILEMLCPFGIKTDLATNAEDADEMLKTFHKSGKTYDTVIFSYDIFNKSKEILKDEPLLLTGSFSQWCQFTGNRDNTPFFIKPLFPSDIKEAIIQAVQPKVRTKKETGSLKKQDFTDITVLLVEDVEVNREIFLALLEDTGLNTVEAQNGLEAVSLFKENPKKYDMIIMDIQMPLMDGYEATRTIRNLNEAGAENLPIVAMTANAFKDDVQRYLDCGMNDHMAKPIDEDALINMIIKYCR